MLQLKNQHFLSGVLRRFYLFFRERKREGERERETSMICERNQLAAPPRHPYQGWNQQPRHVL